MSGAGALVSLPCHAVIFISKRSAVDDGYAEATARMQEIGTKQPGFLGITSARAPDGAGITVAFYSTAEAARQWGRHPAHREVITSSRQLPWYEAYTIYYAELTAGRVWQHHEEG